MWAAGGGRGGGAAPLLLEGVPPAAPPLQAPPLAAAAPQARAAALFTPRGRLAVIVAVLVPQRRLGKGENTELIRGGGVDRKTLAHSSTADREE